MPKNIRAVDHLHDDVISMVISTLECSIGETWDGGSVYFPSTNNPTSSLWTKEEKAHKRALAVVAVIDGFSMAEAAAMTEVNERLVSAWVKRYGDQVRDALRSIRKDK